jgi:hypothetical protein
VELVRDDFGSTESGRIAALRERVAERLLAGAVAHALDREEMWQRHQASRRPLGTGDAQAIVVAGAMSTALTRLARAILGTPRHC